ncbi:MAG: hypothetical protein JWP01_3966 [Myxococcales bacterium]|nr:hypothetical protein [Myxococcales bacterium]
MHPHTFYSTLFRPTKREEVFVAMSFAPEFEERWQRVIEPCIREDLKLTPSRVDFGKSGESVVHDILDGIAHARLVLVDITSTELTDDQDTRWPVRNGNVMWELGIAHVLRMPDEVIVVRSDNADSLFDLTQFRAFNYDPNDVASARQVLSNIAKDRLRSIDLSASDHVRRVAESLDFDAWMILFTAIATQGGMKPPLMRTMGEHLSNMKRVVAIQRLLELGALTTSFVGATPELLKAADDTPAEDMMLYRVSAFGRALMLYSAKQQGMFSPEVMALIPEVVDKGKPPSE